MTSQLNSKPEKNKSDLINLFILISVAAVIGIYLIATTVLISKDGVFYIERAQQFAHDPIKITKDFSPGQSFLIFLAHKFATFFTNSTSNHIWLYSAQGVTLLCRLLAIIPLYFIGKLLVGPRNSFWGALILIFLPDSAEFASDALTEWPHIMVLAIGFLLLLWAARSNKSWIFGLAGIIAGLGYLTRSEGCQVILYGTTWLIFNIIRPQVEIKRTKAAEALLFHLAGFAIIAIPYMLLSGYIFPDQNMWKLPVLSTFSNQGCNSILNENICLSGLSIKRIIGNETLITNVSETLMYYFVPALPIGCYYYFRKRSKTLEQTFFAAAFIVLNVAMLYWQSDRFLSRRHTLALVVFMSFYIPIGLDAIARWLTEMDSKKNLSIPKNSRRWFFILLVIGLAICTPKLLRPIRVNKQGYLETAKWLKENTTPNDIIAAPDRRVYFYADRKGIVYQNNKLPPDSNYLVRIVGNEEENADLGGNIREEFSVWVDQERKKKRLIVYKTM